MSGKQRIIILVLYFKYCIGHTYNKLFFIYSSNLSIIQFCEFLSLKLKITWWLVDQKKKRFLMTCHLITWLSLPSVMRKVKIRSHLMCKKWFATELLESFTFLTLTLIFWIDSLFLHPREDTLLRYWVGEKCAFLWQSKTMIVTNNDRYWVLTEAENLDVCLKLSIPSHILCVWMYLGCYNKMS